MMPVLLVRAGYDGSVGKEPTCQGRRHRRRGFSSWVGKIPWRRKWQATPAFLPGEFHGWRSLAGHSPGVTESGTTELLNSSNKAKCTGSLWSALLKGRAQVKFTFSKGGCAGHSVTGHPHSGLRSHRDVRCLVHGELVLCVNAGLSWDISDLSDKFSSKFNSTLERTHSHASPDMRISQV